MKFRFEYQLKNGDSFSTVDFLPEDIKQSGDFLGLTLEGKKLNRNITVTDPNGREIKTTFSEVESVKIVFID